MPDVRPKKLIELPSNPAAEEDAAADGFEASTWWDMLVSRWAGITLFEARDLPVRTWLVLRRDAFIDRMRQTPGGREWLSEAWRLTRTDMDREGLREITGGKKAG